MLVVAVRAVQQVVVVGESVNKGLVEQAGLQAAVPTIVKAQSPANLGFAGAATYDAVVSLGAISGMSPVQRKTFFQVGAVDRGILC